jgi:hypothetical protein
MDLVTLAIVIIGLWANLNPVMHPNHDATVHDSRHTGASVEFAMELAEIHQGVNFDKVYGEGWEIYAGLSMVEADVSNAMNDILMRVMDSLDLDPRARLSVVGA